MEPKSKVPALIPAFSLTEEKSNIVAYSIRGSNKTTFCEDVTVINGWVNLVNLRIKEEYTSVIELIRPVCRYTGNFDQKVSKGNPQGSMKVSGYTTVTSKSMHQQFVETIDSYNKNELEAIDLWARTSKEEALQQSDKKKTDYNTETLISNRLKFSYFIITLIEDFLDKEFRAVPGWKKWLLRLERPGWISKERKSFDRDKLEKELIERVKAEYEEAKIEYEGVLTYDRELGTKVFNFHGRNLNYNNIKEGTWLES